jgi:P27 family predicted phage terminase small subunit
MAKKPKLSLVKPLPLIGSDPPRSLGQAGRKLWRTLTSEFVIDDAAGLEMLTQICAATDRLVALQETIEADGLMVRTKAGPKEHPLLKIELSTRAFIMRGIGRLGLDVEPLKTIGRPPGGGVGWRPD